jgi:hypothetical protein
MKSITLFIYLYLPFSFVLSQYADYYHECVTNDLPIKLGCVLCSKKWAHLRAIQRGDRQLESVESVFNKVYNEKRWGDKGGGSGVGSENSYGIVARQILQLLVYKYNIVHLIDAPCGHVSKSWMKTAIMLLRQQLPCFKYYGVDVVKSVIDDNKLLYTNASFVAFDTMDLSKSEAMLPSGYDLIISRDALQHLSYKSIAGVVSTYCRSGATFLLVGSYLESVWANKDIQDGAWFFINLLKPPFSFPEPLELFSEYPMNGVIKDSKQHLLYNMSALCTSPSFLNFINNSKI